MMNRSNSDIVRTMLFPLSFVHLDCILTEGELLVNLLLN
jgi:hypothetical protein